MSWINDDTKRAPITLERIDELDAVRLELLFEQAERHAQHLLNEVANYRDRQGLKLDTPAEAAGRILRAMTRHGHELATAMDCHEKLQQAAGARFMLEQTDSGVAQ